jgi:hypothetical protein
MGGARSPHGDDENYVQNFGCNARKEDSWIIAKESQIILFIKPSSLHRRLFLSKTDHSRPQPNTTISNGATLLLQTSILRL